MTRISDGGAGTLGGGALVTINGPQLLEVETEVLAESVTRHV
jgi:hypothetical protein